MADRYDEEIRRLAGVLATVVRMAGRTRQSLEGQIGLSSGYLSKILSGTVDLRARHILAIVEALGLSPGDFFALAYPQRERPGSPEGNVRRLIDEAKSALGHAPPRTTEAPEESPEFDARVKRSLARLLGIPGDEQSGPE